MAGKFLCPRCFELQSLDSIEYICSNTSTISKFQGKVTVHSRKNVGPPEAQAGTGSPCSPLLPCFRIPNVFFHIPSN